MLKGLSYWKGWYQKQAFFNTSSSPPVAPIKQLPKKLLQLRLTHQQAAKYGLFNRLDELDEKFFLLVLGGPITQPELKVIVSSLMQLKNLRVFVVLLPERVKHTIKSQTLTYEDHFVHQVKSLQSHYLAYRRSMVQLTMLSRTRGKLLAVSKDNMLQLFEEEKKG